MKNAGAAVLRRFGAAGGGSAVKECELGQVTMRLRSEVLDVEKTENGYALALNGEK